jgi:hypothetical protein
VFGAAWARDIFLEVFILRGFKSFKTEVLILRELQTRFCGSADNAELGCSWHFPSRRKNLQRKKASGPAKGAAP